MLEKQIERKLVQNVEKAGGKAIKLNCPGFSGMPDRMVIFPGGRLYFVEMKAPGRKPTPLQTARMLYLEALGFDTRTIDTPEGVEAFIKEVSPHG